MSRIVTELNEAGVKTKHGRDFTINSLRTILTNRMYLGEYRYAEIVIPGGVPAIISEEDYNEVRNRHASNKHAPKARTENEAPRFWLTGSVFCPMCGSPIVGVSGTGRNGKHYYYACSNKWRNKTCKKRNIKQADLERAVLHGLSCFLQDPASLLALTASISDYYRRKNSDTSFIDSLEAELKTTEKALNNLVKALEAGIFTRTTQQRMVELEQKQQSLQETIETEKLKQQIAYEPTLIRRYLSTYMNTDIQDVDTRDMVFNHFVDRIYVHDDGHIVITCKFKDTPLEVSLNPARNEPLETIKRTLHVPADGFEQSSAWWSIPDSNR